MYRISVLAALYRDSIAAPVSFGSSLYSTDLLRITSRRHAALLLIRRAFVP